MSDLNRSIYGAP